MTLLQFNQKLFIVFTITNAKAIMYLSKMAGYHDISRICIYRVGINSLATTSNTKYWSLLE